MNGRELDPQIEGYLRFLEDVKRLAHRSVVDARCTLKKVCTYMAASKGGAPLWKAKFEDFLDWLNHERDQARSPTVLAKDLCHLRGLLDYAWRSGRADRNVLDGFTIQDSLRPEEPRSLTLDEARRIVSAFGRNNRQERRKRLIVLLLYGCGLRTFELRGLDVSDVDVERQELFVRHGKGDRERRVPVPGAVWTELLAYLVERRGKRGALFRTEIKHRRISSKMIGDVVQEASRRAEFPEPITPKALRHSFATHLMDRGVGLAVIASLMGHRSVNETGVYLHVLPGKKEAAVAKLEGTR
jgi:site-specific recombinase XerD